MVWIFSGCSETEKQQLHGPYHLRSCLHGGARLKVCIVGQLVRKNNVGQRAKGQQDVRKIGRY
jgi:trehalose-6-phosphatase